MCHVKVWPEQCEKHGVEHDKESYFYRSELHYGRHLTVIDLADCRTCIFFFLFGHLTEMDILRIYSRSLAHAPYILYPLGLWWPITARQVLEG